MKKGILRSNVEYKSDSELVSDDENNNDNNNNNSQYSLFNSQLSSQSSVVELPRKRRRKKDTLWKPSNNNNNNGTNNSRADKASIWFINFFVLHSIPRTPNSDKTSILIVNMCADLQDVLDINNQNDSGSNTLCIDKNDIFLV